MTLTSYKQFCPVAMAAEILCTRWTMLVLRELYAGTTRFNDLRRGVPRMSPALLSQRLKELEEAGIIVRRPSRQDRSISEYLLSEAGKELGPIIEAFGVWGQRWVQKEISLQHLDAQLLMWDMRRNLNTEPMPQQRSVIQFLYPEQAAKDRAWWLIVEPGAAVDLCLVDPGYDVDLYCSTDLYTMTAIWMGHDTVRNSIKTDRLHLTGDRKLASQAETWLGLSPSPKCFSPVEPLEKLSSQVCISGGGPAGLMLGYLLARQGVNVVVLEKHADFLRDFRGDTIHPATLEIFHELGLAEGLLALPHQKTERIELTISDETIPFADFTHLPVHYPYIAMMPQWDLLDFIADEAQKFPNFRLLMNTEATGLIEQGVRVVGIRADGPEGPLEIRAGLNVAADGRTSRLREASGLAVEDIGAPIDVFWMRIARTGGATNDSLGRIGEDGMLVLINRGTFWQGALPVPKGSADTIRAQGLPAFRARLSRLAPILGEAVNALTSWDEIKLLTVQVNHTPKWWRPGFICIGDAAHAMSPVGGVGINLAVQDAVAAARILGPHIKAGTVPGDALAAVQKRRHWPARMTQRAQVFAHRFILVPAITPRGPPKVLFPLRLFRWIPLLRRLPARAVGLGLRPEHWRGP